MRDDSGPAPHEVLIEIRPGLAVRVLQHAHADAVIDAAIRDPAVDVYAHILWPASLAAAQVLADHIRPGDVVLDVGAGTGLCALAAALLGAHVIALDRDTRALERISDAAARNGVIVRTMPFDFQSTRPLPRCSIAAFADVAYEPALARAVAARVIEVLEQGAVVIIADPGRAARQELDAVLLEHGYTVAYHDVTVRVPGDTEAVVQVAVLPAARPAP